MSKNERNLLKLEKIRQPLYDAMFSILSGAAGGAIFKISDSSVGYFNKKITEYRQAKLEYKEKETEKIANTLADKIMEELGKYFHEEWHRQPTLDKDDTI